MANPLLIEHTQLLDETRGLLIQLMVEKSGNQQSLIIPSPRTSSLTDYGNFMALVKERVSDERTALIVIATVLREIEASRTRDIN